MVFQITIEISPYHSIWWIKKVWRSNLAIFWKRDDNETFKVGSLNHHVIIINNWLLIIFNPDFTSRMFWLHSQDVSTNILIKVTEGNLLLLKEQCLMSKV